MIKIFQGLMTKIKYMITLKIVELVKSALILLKKLIRCTIQSNKKALNQ